jgi:hypothetical protein
MADSLVHGSIQDDGSLFALMLPAFEEAYPDVPDWRAEHIARNFSQIQIVSGVISVGKRLPVEETGETSHMDMVNSIVFWCVANTHLEDFLEKPDPRPDDECVIPAADAQLLMHEFCARIGDWLAGLEALKADRGLYEAFIKGAVALGGQNWERDRGELAF